MLELEKHGSVSIDRCAATQNLVGLHPQAKELQRQHEAVSRVHEFAPVSAARKEAHVVAVLGALVDHSLQQSALGWTRELEGGEETGRGRGSDAGAGRGGLVASAARVVESARRAQRGEHAVDAVRLEACSDEFTTLGTGSHVKVATQSDTVTRGRQTTCAHCLCVLELLLK